MKVEIEIADELLARIPDGHEPLELRAPREGEVIVMNHFNGVGEAEHDYSSPAYRLILRKKFDPIAVAKEWWPKCLKGAAVARDKDGHWFVYTHDPVHARICWQVDKGTSTSLYRGFITPPPIPDDVPWTEAIIFNPWRE